MSSLLRAAALVVPALTGLAAGAGCGDLDPTVGPLVSTGPCSNEDSRPGQDVSFSRDIAPIFRGDVGPGCRCHLPDEPDPIGLELAMLDLSSYATLRAGGAMSGPDIVIPGEPCRSLLVLKVSPTPPFGSRMPFDGPPTLDAETRQRIADWIAEGAEDD